MLVSVYPPPLFLYVREACFWVVNGEFRSGPVLVLHRFSASLIILRSFPFPPPLFQLLARVALPGFILGVDKFQFLVRRIDFSGRFD